MVELKDIAEKNNIDLEDCIVFVRGENDILAVDSTHAGIKQRTDNVMAFQKQDLDQHTTEVYLQ